jgi:hypothetical protein
MTLTYDDYEIDEAAIPARNVLWMLQSTLRWLMGNQVDAALSTWIKGQANGQDPEAFRGANAAAVGRKRDELRQAMLDRILHVTLGERLRVDPLEKEMRRGCALAAAGRRTLAALHVAKREERTSSKSPKVGTGFNRKSSMEIRKKLDAIVSREFQITFGENPRLKGASWILPEIVESRPYALRSSRPILARVSRRSMRGSVSCRWCSLSALASSSHYSL